MIFKNGVTNDGEKVIIKNQIIHEPCDLVLHDNIFINKKILSNLLSIFFLKKLINIYT